MNRRAFIRTLGTIPIIGCMFYRAPGEILKDDEPSILEALSHGKFDTSHAVMTATPEVWAKLRGEQVGADTMFWRRMYLLAHNANEYEGIYVNDTGMNVLWADFYAKQNYFNPGTQRKTAYFFFSGVQVWNALPETPDQDPRAEMGAAAPRHIDVRRT